MATEFFHPHRGGIETHVQALAKHLQEAGTRAEVTTAFPGPSVLDGIAVHRVPAPLLPGLQTVWTTHGVAPFVELLRARSYDLVHCHLSVYSPGASAAAYLAQRMGIPTVVTFHSLMGGYTRAFKLLDRLWGWSRLPIVFTAVSELVAGQVAPLLGDRPVAVLPSAVDVERWSPLPPRPSEGSFRIVSAMRLAKRKRPRALVEILARVRDRLASTCPLRVRIMGEGAERGALARLISERGLTDTVELCGQVTPEELHQAYADADVFVLPSVEESFGLAVLEARTTGLPVVVRDGTGPAQFIGHEREGLVAGSDRDVAEALVRLALDPALRERIARHNREHPPFLRWDESLRLHRQAYTAAMELRA